MHWERVAFIDYLQAVSRELGRMYGIDSNDVGEDYVRACHEAGDSPGACAEDLGIRHNLDRVDLGPYGGIRCA